MRERRVGGKLIETCLTTLVARVEFEESEMRAMLLSSLVIVVVIIIIIFSYFYSLSSSSLSPWGTRWNDDYLIYRNTRISINSLPVLLFFFIFVSVSLSLVVFFYLFHHLIGSSLISISSFFFSLLFLLYIDWSIFISMLNKIWQVVILLIDRLYSVCE